MEIWASLTNLMASIVLIRAIAREFIPRELFDLLHQFIRNSLRFLSSYMSILIEEEDSIGANDVYESVATYLGSRSSSSEAKRLRLGGSKNGKEFTFTIAKNERIVDAYDGIKVQWKFRCTESRTQRASYEKRCYEIKFNKKDKNRVLDAYFPRIMAEGNALNLKGRPRRIYSNRNRWWTPTALEHPATFDTLALDPHLKMEIMEDLTKFSNAKDYYKKVGRAWKRGYLLYGPPGTGKSSMIAAIANFLEYDVYDLELTQVSNNIELRNLLVATTSRSVIVIEDIDCSLDLSDRNKKKKKKKQLQRKEKDEGSNPSNDEENEESADRESRVTLSGVLNFTDGLWSCCGNERLIVFTTNHIDRLDPALLRAGRMDRCVHLSYCGFPAFKVLARNYLEIEDHPLFGDIEGLIEGAEISPADVCEVLMTSSENPTSALQNLIEVLTKCKAVQNSAATGTEVRQHLVQKANLNTEESQCPDGADEKWNQTCNPGIPPAQHS